MFKPLPVKRNKKPDTSQGKNGATKTDNNAPNSGATNTSQDNTTNHMPPGLHV